MVRFDEKRAKKIFFLNEDNPFPSHTQVCHVLIHVCTCKKSKKQSRQQEKVTKEKKKEGETQRNNQVFPTRLFLFVCLYFFLRREGKRIFIYIHTHTHIHPYIIVHIFVPVPCNLIFNLGRSIRHPIHTTNPYMNEFLLDGVPVVGTIRTTNRSDLTNRI